MNEAGRRTAARSTSAGRSRDPERYVFGAIFNTVLGEELLFRGFLLPRMNGTFGRVDWLANGVLFSAYHLHEPWVFLSPLADAVVLAYPTKRYRAPGSGSQSTAHGAP